MNTYDRAFLEDITHFTAMNRFTSEYALFKGITDLEEIALFVVNNIWQSKLSTQDILQYGDTIRVQRILIAKIFAELVSAYEDLGSLCDAIKNRNSPGRAGIFNRCVSGSTRQSAQFLEEVYNKDIPNHPEITLDVLLRLPSVQDLAERLSQNMLHDLSQMYHQIPQQLYAVSEHYRAKRQHIAKVDAKDLPHTNSVNDVTILLGITSAKEDAKSSGINVDAFNKIKHQFLVTEDLSKYVDLSAEYQIEFARFRMSTEFVNLLMQNTKAVAQMMRILANIVLHLDAIGASL